jgi:hypothetical protein
VSSKTVSDGMACHISAASSGPGAKRFNLKLTSSQRQSADNGIWMCYTHGKLIDTDEVRFPIKLLKSWKKIAESITTIMVEQGCQYEKAVKSLEGKALLNTTITIAPNNENEIIGNALVESCIELFWGQETSDAIRDYLIEHTRNSIIHGKATEVRLEISPKKVSIFDNGHSFNPNKLITSSRARGGAKSLERLQSLKASIVVVNENFPSKNHTSISIIRSSQDILAITDCSISIKREDLYRSRSPVDVKVPDHCNEFFIVLPEYFCYSDLGLLHNLNISSTTVKVHFIPNKVSVGALKTLKEEFPKFNFLEI